MSGIVVMVGKPLDCKKCNGSGVQALGFVHGPFGAICEACKGAKYTHEAMPIAEFAKLFTYGPTYRSPNEAPDNELRVRETENGGVDGE